MVHTLFTRSRILALRALSWCAKTATACTHARLCTLIFYTKVLGTHAVLQLWAPNSVDSREQFFKFFNVQRSTLLVSLCRSIKTDS